MQFFEIYRAGCDGRLSKSEGAGSRGGKVIGTTASGKPIYDSRGGIHAKIRSQGAGDSIRQGKLAHHLHEGWSSSDHKDAAAAHSAHAKTLEFHDRDAGASNARLAASAHAKAAKLGGK